MKTHIGYHNHTNSPLSIHHLGAQVTIEPNSPITDSHGLLIAASEKLDQLVSQGLIKRIYDDDARYKNWDKIKTQRNVVAGLDPANKKVVDNRPNPEPEPVTVISSDSGIHTSDLPEGAQWSRVGDRDVITYDGKNFPSVASLNVYLKEQKSETQD